MLQEDQIMNIKMKNILFLLLLVFTASCYSKEEKLACIYKLREDSKNNILSQQIINNLKDSILKWQADSVMRYSFYNTTENWLFDDLVIFNEDSTFAYSWIYQLALQEKSTFDNIQLYFVKKNGNIWQILIASAPIVAYSKEDNDGRRWTFEELQKETDDQLIDYVNSDCKLDTKLIKEWEKRIPNLEWAEKEFWNDHNKEKNKGLPIEKKGPRR